MIVPIVCWTDGCPNRGTEVNRVHGLNPQDLDLFFEGYDESEPEDHCPLCKELGVAEDPSIEHPWELKYFE